MPPNISQGSLIGYARVSTSDQTVNLQVDALNEAGCARIFTDKASGTLANRPQLAAALDYARPGDTLLVWRLDRLGRSLKHLIETVTALDDAGIGFKSIHESIDTRTSTGKLVFHIFAALAEFERELIVDRTKAGLAAARERGARPGRKPSLSPEQVKVLLGLHADGQHTVSGLAEIMKVSRATVYRHLDASPLS
jgi:DNA invertase Pin-like site-specific DNA recombinase